MQSKNGFVAGLFVFAFCAFTIGGIDLYGNIDVRLHSQQGTMALADPDKEIVQYDDVLSTRTLDVKYVSNKGEVIVPQKVVSKENAERLIAGDKIPITYLTNNHQRVLYQNHQLPNPWVWLVVGLIALATAVYALKLRKREAEEL